MVSADYGTTMNLISFLGPTDYSKTTYVLGDKRHSTKFFPAALGQFIKPERVLIFCTPTVKSHHNLVQLTDELRDQGVKAEPIDIPDGHDERDLWLIFDALTENISENDTVVFDITHSFRSLPFLAFLAVAYLKAAKHVQVDGIFYGAYEARVEERNETPVLDLTPFASLLDWLTATRRFVDTGDGKDLSDLLEAGMPPGIQRKDDVSARKLAKHLQRAADAINGVSQALSLARPIETMASAAALKQTLLEAAPSIEEQARPFAVLTDRVMEEYGQFAIGDRSDETSATPGATYIDNQLDMINWYLLRRQTVQAVTLSREWLVSVLAFQWQRDMYKYKGQGGRQEIEHALGNALEQTKPSPNPRYQPSECDTLIQKMPDQVRRDIVAAWDVITKLRNDIAHAGMIKERLTAAQIQKKAHNVYAKLRGIATHFLPSHSIEP